MKGGPSADPVRIGVISDTHNAFDLRIPQLFAGVAHILHGGDIGQPKILLELEKIALVTAVLGNTDDPAFGYRLTETATVGSWRFLVHHIVDPHRLQETLRDRIRREKPHAVIFGHSHKPFAEWIDGVFFFNPGYAGRARFGMPRTVGILHCGPAGIRAEHLPL